MMHEGMMGGHLLWMLFMALVMVIPFWRICSKAGYPGWLGILILIPLVNLIFLYFLAFSQWPAHRRFK
ncbi:hypothetical protein M0534_00990 [Methylonatrum kenyense]|uniref:hypothetical protein n=1 Tax=Methylonatrum kenyense TaxID=455253 RepID=UPI0020C11C3A|nr:hypothetical protein [Methylonatrum kenyense]MCK8514906.1 hypothetical protein [Methylonatrum kenyense]